MATAPSHSIDALLEAQKVYQPPQAILAQDAIIKDWDAEYQRSIRQPEAFWEEEARAFEWSKPWEKVLEWNYPYARWFVGGQTNITINALDRHTRTWRKNKAALIWTAEDGSERILTYGQLLHWVNKTANALKNLGIVKGDRVCIYMPLTPEGIITMLACARLGAIHNVVYAGFSRQALRDRIVDAQAKLLVCADASWRRGKAVDLKAIVDDAVAGLDVVETVLVHRRRQPKIELKGRERDFTDLVSAASHHCEAEVMDAEDPLFILYTSGTTGKPKGVVMVHGGYMVGTTYHARAFWNLGDNDVYLCTSDIGWIVGHSYIVYAPFCLGVTCLVREGAPDYPDPGVFYRLIEQYGVTRIFTAPTLVRMLMKYGSDLARRYDLSSLRQLTCAGEPMNPEAWEWAYAHICGAGHAWMCDNMWQTETGGPLVCSPLTKPGKPGWCGLPTIGTVADVVDGQGNSLPPGKGGNFVIKNPWPHMFRTVFGDASRYEEYWTTLPNCYMTGDIATKDHDGYIMFLGRSDDVLNVAGHRIGTADVESTLVSHPAVAEAAVIGKPDEIRGEAIKAFVTLVASESPSEEMRRQLVRHVQENLGPIAAPSEIDFVDKLPKTRSGKIMRRYLKALELGDDPGDLSTIED
ncbi:MAG: acetate--CoA ligase [Candidatus Tectomicrobia bacterium]|nr:acetate--CoA ligase [Candidatus Tectomicrobia bacterium]